MRSKVRAVVVVAMVLMLPACGGGSDGQGEAVSWQWLATSPQACGPCQDTTRDPNFGRQTLLPAPPPGWGIIGYNTPRPGETPWFTVTLEAPSPSFHFFLDNTRNLQDWPNGRCPTGSCVPPFAGLMARPEMGTMSAGLSLHQALDYHVSVALGPDFGVAGEHLPCPAPSQSLPFARLELGVVLHDNLEDRNWWLSWSLFRDSWPDFFCGIDGCFIFLNADAGLLRQTGGPESLGKLGAGETATMTFDLSSAVAATIELAATRNCPLPSLDQGASVIGLWAGAEVAGEARAEFTLADLGLEDTGF